MKAPRLLLSALRQARVELATAVVPAQAARKRVPVRGRLLTRSTSCGSHKQVGVFTPGSCSLAKLSPCRARRIIPVSALI